jgi:hypothetical protein
LELLRGAIRKPAIDMRIPVVNERQEIVGWTQSLPHMEGDHLNHEDAERLLGSAIVCTPVFLTRHEDMEHAEDPLGVLGGWSMHLAICPLACLSLAGWGRSVHTPLTD